METDPRKWIASIRSSHEQLDSLVRPLTPADLLGPSYDDDWNVAQVLSHIGSQGEIFAKILSANLEGRETPSREEFPPIWEAWNSRTPEEQAADSLTVDAELVQELEGLSDSQLDAMHLDLFGMELDAVALASMRLGEHSVHTWDVAVALDPDAQIAPDAVELLVDTLPQVVGRAGKAQGSALSVRVQTAAPDRDFQLTSNEDVQLSGWEGQEVDGTLQIPAEAFLRLVYGRLDADHTPPVNAEGVELDQLRAIFPGF